MDNASKNGSPVRRDEDILAFLYEDSARLFEAVSKAQKQLAQYIRENGRESCIQDGADCDQLAHWTCALRHVAAECHRAT
jgi:hypothetical protein